MATPNLQSLYGSLIENERRKRILLGMWVSELEPVLITIAGYVQGIGALAQVEAQGYATDDLIVISWKEAR